MVAAGLVIEEAYDSTVFDAGAVDDAAGSYDYSIGVSQSANDFDLGTTGVDSSRLLVTLNGNQLFDGETKRLVNEARVEVDIGVQLARGKVLVVQCHFFQF